MGTVSCHPSVWIFDARSCLIAVQKFLIGLAEYIMQTKAINKKNKLIRKLKKRVRSDIQSK